jgi:hypothetical protein
MIPKALLAAAALLFAAPQIAICQNTLPDDSDVYTRPESAALPAPAELSDARLLAGVRAYPPGVLRALFTVSEQPALMRQLAQDPQKLMDPQTINPPLAAELQSAVRQLQQDPEIVALAAAYPQEVERLRRLYESAPEQTEQRLAELRARYDAARLQGDQAWQELLSHDAAALDQYRELVTQFTRDQLKQYRDFPYVEVRQPQYYYAAPPNDLIMAYAQDRKPGALLESILNKWWDQYGPDQADERVLSRSEPLNSGPSLAALPPQERAEMWHPATDRTNPGAALLPIIMQPMADQPPDARAAFALAENARLWSGPENGWLTQPPPVAAAPEGAPPDVAQQYAPSDTGSSTPPDQAPVCVEPSPDYEYEYTPEYEEPPQYVYAAPTVYYSPLVPYYYAYPAVWPVAYSCYPGLSSCWPYYWYGPGAYFAFSFGCGPHYYRCGRACWNYGYRGLWGRSCWGRPYASRYYGNRYYGNYYGHRYYGDRYGGLGRISRYGRAGDRFPNRYADRHTGGSAHSTRGERLGGSRDRFSAGRGGGTGQQSRGHSFSRFGGRTFQGSQHSRPGGGSRSLDRRGQGSRQSGGNRSYERRPALRRGTGSVTYHRGQPSRGSSFIRGSRDLGSIRRSPHTRGTSGMTRRLHSTIGRSASGHPMGTIRSRGGAFHGGGRHNGRR